jgi:hypothetical protein
MSVSLDNFDPNTSAKKPLDSPRSIEACRRQGIEPADLLVKSKEKIAKELGRNPDPEIV